MRVLRWHDYAAFLGSPVFYNYTKKYSAVDSLTSRPRLMLEWTVLHSTLAGFCALHVPSYFHSAALSMGNLADRKPGRLLSSDDDLTQSGTSFIWHSFRYVAVHFHATPLMGRCPGPDTLLRTPASAIDRLFQCQCWG